MRISDYLEKPQIYGFAFGGVRNLLYRLKEITCCYLVFGETSIEKYMKFLLHDQPEYILGLGSYSGVDQDKIRIETVCTNKFRNGFVAGGSLVETPIRNFLYENEVMKEAKGLGNSWCNYISWKIVYLIEQRQLKSMYTFLHIPKTFKHWSADKQIDSALTAFKVREYPKTGG
jgi:pyrrolidone-carboxylate peptidase